MESTSVLHVGGARVSRGVPLSSNLVSDLQPPSRAAGASRDAEPSQLERAARVGALYAVGSYAWWGFVGPQYFRWLGEFSATLLMCHRVVWSLAMLAILVALGRQWKEVRRALITPRLRAWLMLSAVLLGINWYLFIVAIDLHRLKDASFGYFINPIWTIVLGMIFLHERLRAVQWVAVVLATLGLVVLTIARGFGGDGFPWISIALPASFGFYSLIRKKLAIESLPGLFIESLLLMPVALAWLTWVHATSEQPNLNAIPTWAALLLAGPVTTLPMLWFIAGARRLTLTTIGFLQFISPTLQFFTAVVLWGEVFTRSDAVAFGLIWVAVAINVVATLRRRAPES